MVGSGWGGAPGHGGWEALSEKVLLELRLSHAKSLQLSVSGQGNGRGRGPEVGLRLAQSTQERGGKGEPGGSGARPRGALSRFCCWLGTSSCTGGL